MHRIISAFRSHVAATYCSTDLKRYHGNANFHERWLAVVTLSNVGALKRFTCSSIDVLCGPVRI